MWELATEKEVRRLTRHEGSVSPLAVTPDARYITSGS